MTVSCADLEISFSMTARLTASWIIEVYMAEYFRLKQSIMASLLIYSSILYSISYSFGLWYSLSNDSSSSRRTLSTSTLSFVSIAAIYRCKPSLPLRTTAASTNSNRLDVPIKKRLERRLLSSIIEMNMAVALSPTPEEVS